MSDQSKAGSNQGNDHANEKRRFKTLRFVRMAYYYLACAVFLISVVATPFGFAASSGDAAVSFFIGIPVGAIIGAIIALPMLVAFDFIRWMLEVVKELRRNNTLLERALSK